MRAFEKRLDVSFFSSFGREQCELDAALGAVRVHDEIVIEVVDYFQVRVGRFPFPFVQFVERGGDDELAQVPRVVLQVKEMMMMMMMMKMMMMMMMMRQRQKERESNKRDSSHDD